MGPGHLVIRHRMSYDFDRTEEALIGVVRQFPPDKASKVLWWPQQLREIAGSGSVQWSDSWNEEDLADARRTSIDDFSRGEGDGH